MSENDGSKDDLKWVSSTAQGRKFIWEMLSYCGVYKDLAGEPVEVAKQLGKRQVGLHILGLLDDLNDEIIFSMMREAKNRKREQEIKDDIRDRKDRANNDSTTSRADALVYGSHASSSGADDTIGGYEAGGANL